MHFPDFWVLTEEWEEPKKRCNAKNIGLCVSVEGKSLSTGYFRKFKNSFTEKIHNFQ